MRDIFIDPRAVFGMTRCEDCGLVYLCPRPDGPGLDHYYRDIYSGRGGEQMRRAQTEGGIDLVNAARWGLLRKYVDMGPGDRLLDIGCGYGSFLSFMQRRAGCEIHGVDSDEGSIAAAVCREQGELRVGSLHEADYPDGHFKLLVMLQSLEHMTEPLAVLREARRVLAPGGTLLVEVPNYGALLRSVFGRYWFPLLVPQHLVHFETASLARMLAAAGFEEPLLLRPSWSPIELTLSAGLRLWHWMGWLGTYDNPEPRQGLGPRIGMLALVLIYLLGELPLALPLRLLGLSGHLTAVVRKPAEEKET